MCTSSRCSCIDGNLAQHSSLISASARPLPRGPQCSLVEALIALRKFLPVSSLLHALVDLLRFRVFTVLCQ